jgi:peptide/nickel transport system permease protein
MFRRKNKQKAAGKKTYWSYVRRQFGKNKRALFAMYIVCFLAIIAIFADFLASDKPIVMKYENSWYTPIFKQYAVDLGIGKWSSNLLNPDWKNLQTDFAVWPLIPYAPSNINIEETFISPFDEQKKGEQHWFGTDNVGRDVAAGMIHGTRIAFMVGMVSMGIAFVIGVFLGGFAGYFGDDKLKISKIRILMNILALPFAFFYGFISRSYILGDAFSASFFNFLGAFSISILLFLIVLLITNLIVFPFKKLNIWTTKVALPLDLLITRLIEVVVSIPVLVLILAVIAIAKPSIYNVMIVIGLVSWTGIARFVRAELLKVRNLEYMEAASALGYSSFRTVFKHAIPNALSPVFIALAFGIAGAILVESFLSFLGFGVAAETITWGKLLAVSRENNSAWWLAVFPGFAIFITVTVFNLIGEGLTDALDPRLKQ